MTESLSPTLSALNLKLPTLEAATVLDRANQKGGASFIAERNENLSGQVAAELQKKVQLLQEVIAAIPSADQLKKHHHEVQSATMHVHDVTKTAITYDHTMTNEAKERALRVRLSLIEVAAEVQPNVSQVLLAKLTESTQYLQRQLTPFLDFANTDPKLQPLATELQNTLSQLTEAFRALQNPELLVQTSEKQLNAKSIRPLFTKDDVDIRLPAHRSAALKESPNAANEATIAELVYLLKVWLAEGVMANTRNLNEALREKMHGLHEKSFTMYSEFAQKLIEFVKGTDRLLQNIEFMAIYNTGSEIRTAEPPKATEVINLHKMEESKAAALLDILDSQDFDKSQEVNEMINQAFQEISKEALDDVDAGKPMSSAQDQLEADVQRLTNGTYDLGKLSTARHDELKATMLQDPAKESLRAGSARTLLVHDSTIRGATYSGPGNAELNQRGKILDGLHLKAWQAAGALIFPSDISSVVPIVAQNPSERHPSKTGSEKTVNYAVQSGLVKTEQLGSLPDFGLQITLSDNTEYSLFFNSYFDSGDPDRAYHFVEFVLMQKGTVVVQDRVPSRDQANRPHQKVYMVAE